MAKSLKEKVDIIPLRYNEVEHRYVRYYKEDDVKEAVLEFNSLTLVYSPSQVCYSCHKEFYILYRKDDPKQHNKTLWYKCTDCTSKEIFGVWKK